MNKQWILGTEYDLDASEDKIRLMNFIDERRAAGAVNDLSMVCYGVLTAYAEKQGRIDVST